MSESDNKFNYRDGVSLKDYVDELNEAQCLKCAAYRKGIDEKFITAAQAMELTRQVVDNEFRAIEKATDLAREQLDLKLEGMNEFRDENRRNVEMMSRTFMPRTEYAVNHQQLVEKLDDMGKKINEFTTRREYALQVEKYDTEIRSLRESRVEMETKASVKAVNIAYAFAAIGAVLSIVSLIMAIVMH